MGVSGVFLKHLWKLKRLWWGWVRGGGRVIVYLLHETLPNLTRSIKLKTRCHNDSRQSKWYHVSLLFFRVSWVHTNSTPLYVQNDVRNATENELEFASVSWPIKWAGFFCQEITEKLHVSFPITFEKRLHKLEKILPKLYSQDKFSEPLYIEGR